MGGEARIIEGGLIATRQQCHAPKQVPLEKIVITFDNQHSPSPPLTWITGSGRSPSDTGPARLVTGRRADEQLADLVFGI